MDSDCQLMEVGVLASSNHFGINMEGSSGYVLLYADGMAAIKYNEQEMLAMLPYWFMVSEIEAIGESTKK